MEKQPQKPSPQQPQPRPAPVAGKEGENPKPSPPTAKKPVPRTPAPQVQNGKKEKPHGFIESLFSHLRAEKYRQPGKFDSLFQASQAILGSPEFFDGFHMSYARLVSPYFEVSHAISFASAIEPPSYSFTAAYRKPGTMLRGRFYPTSRAVQGNLVAHFFKNSLVLRINAKASPKPNMSDATVEVDYKAPDYTASLTYAAATAATVAYTQSITETLAAGIRCFYDMNQGSSGYTLGMKWVQNLGVWAMSYTSVGMFNLSYTQSRYNKRKQWTTDMEIAKMPGQDRWEAIWAVGVRYALLGTSFLARLDSQLRASMFLEERTNENISIFMCAEMDYLKDNYKIGFGLSITS